MCLNAALHAAGSFQPSPLGFTFTHLLSKFGGANLFANLNRVMEQT